MKDQSFFNLKPYIFHFFLVIFYWFIIAVSMQVICRFQLVLVLIDEALTEITKLTMQTPFLQFDCVLLLKIRPNSNLYYFIFLRRKCIFFIYEFVIHKDLSCITVFCLFLNVFLFMTIFVQSRDFLGLVYRISWFKLVH